MISHTKKGFTLIEVIIGMLISTLLLSAAFTVYNQITKSINIIQNITTDDTKLIILYDRLQQDFTGIAPLWFTKKQYEQAKKGTAKENNEEQAEQVAKNKDQDIEHNNFFYAINKDNNFAYFTFITTNAMQMYGSDNKRFVRVVYQLQAESNKENTYRIVRKEINKITPQFDKKIIEDQKDFYTIASNVKKCFFEYGFIDQAKPKEKKSQAKEKPKQEDKKPAQIAWHKEWGVVREDTKTNEYKPALPQYIKMKIVFANQQDKEGKEHELYITIPINGQIKLQPFVKKRQKQAKEAKEVKTPAKGKESSAKTATPSPHAQVGK